MNKIILGDCLDIMRGYADNQFDLVLTDPPYGMTANDWDTVVEFMDEALRVSRGVVLTAMQPYSSELVVRYRKHFKYEWVWHKAVGSNFANLKHQPMREHEQILVFGNLKYNPVMQERRGSGDQRIKHKYAQSGNNSTTNIERTTRNNYADMRYPSTVQYFNNRDIDARGFHPTQKPLKMFEYLVRTYTDENDTVLDPFLGSGTTALACKNLNRNYIGIEINPDYVKIAQDRLKQRTLL